MSDQHVQILSSAGEPKYYYIRRVDLSVKARGKLRDIIRSTWQVSATLGS
jgi:hypothetical protein